MSEAPGKKPARGDGPGGLVVVVLVVVLGAALLERFSRPQGGRSIEPTPMPDLLVEGWLNTDESAAPSVESLAGRHAVIDFWATWCGPCLQSMPKLVELEARWRDRGVSLIALTAEPTDSMARIQGAVDSVPGAAWPVGYGAGLVFDRLGVTMLPTYALVDPQGRVVWMGHRVDALDRELEARVVQAKGSQPSATEPQAY